MNQHIHTSTPTTEDFEGLAASFVGVSGEIPQMEEGAGGVLVGGLAQQIELSQAINPYCGAKVTRLKDNGLAKTYRQYCGWCHKCHERKAKETKTTIAMNITRRRAANPALIVSIASDILPEKQEAFLKRLQRDNDAEYFRTINLSGNYDFIVQSTKSYGELTTNGIRYDWLMSVKASQAQGKRQTGKLRIPEDNRGKGKKGGTYPLNTIEVKAVNPDDAGDVDRIVQNTPPITIAYDAESHQKSVFEWARLVTGALDANGIEYTTTGIIGRSTVIRREQFNESVQIVSVDKPNGGYLDNQPKLFDGEKLSRKKTRHYYV